MHVAVLGASRNTGQSFVEQALDKDIRVTVLARSPEKLPFTTAQLDQIEVVKGDALVKDDVAKTIRGADIVLSLLGAQPQGLGMNDLGADEAGIGHILQIVKETRADNPPYIIMVSSAGVGTLADVPLALRALSLTILRKPLAYKAKAEAAIKDSGIRYTIVRPAMLTSGQLTGTYRAEVNLRGYTIARNDVAHFILHQCVLEDKWRNASPSIAY
ncbi:hypothetical protein GGF46_000776 [Coemansia sp. RSA 552]|nr:hypothetical protein GGF46_000776 [Coemansia sp. RSA 552]